MAGGHAWGGGRCGRGHAWQGCALQGVCVPGGHAWWGHAWQGGMLGRGHAWQGACMAERVCMARAYLAGEMATAVDGTHPTGMYYCFTCS